VLVIYLAASLINLQIQINQKDNDLSELKAQQREQLLKNQEIERLINDENQDEYAEKIARDKLNYAYPNERVIINGSEN